MDVQLDADDTIVSYLHQKGLLIQGEDMEKQDRFVLKSKPDRMSKFLSENSAEIDALICELSGYIGERISKDK